MNVYRLWLKDARIYTVAAITNLGGFFFGYDTGLIGGILAMDSFKESFGLDKLSAGEFAAVSGNIISVLQLGCFIGVLGISPITQFVGRRPAVILTCFVFLFGSLLQVLAGLNGSKALGILYAGRFIGGMGVGAISMLVPIYISETAPKGIRGRCVGMMQLFIVTGIAVSNWINFATVRVFAVSQKQWRIPFGIQLIPGGIILIAMFFMKESPRWLAEHRGREESMKSLAWFRGLKVDDENVVTEVDEIIQSLEEEKKIARPGYLQTIREITRSKSLRWRSLVGLYIQVGQQFTGANAINYYSPLIFGTIGIKGTESELLATGVYGIVKICVCILVLLLSIEQLGRRRALIHGGLGQAVALIIVGIIIKLVPPVASSDHTIHPASYIAIACIYIEVSFYNLSWGPVTWILTGELFPNHVRSFCVAACVGLQWLANYAIAKITPLMIASWGYGTFLFFGGFCVVNAGFIYLTLPETRGLSLEAIGVVFGDRPLEIRDRNARDAQDGLGGVDETESEERKSITEDSESQ